MRNGTILALLVSFAVVTPVQAQDRGRDGAGVPSSGIVDSAVRTALRMELQPTTQRVVRGRACSFLGGYRDDGRRWCTGRTVGKRPGR